MITPGQLTRLMQLLDDPAVADVKDAVVSECALDRINDRHLPELRSATAALRAELGGKLTPGYFALESAWSADTADRERAWFLLGLLASPAHRVVLFGSNGDGQ